MMGNAGNMGKMMKQVQKMQADMARIQEELAQRTVEGVAGGGAVKVTVSGSQEVKGVEILPEVIDPEDREMLQDLLVVAINDGIHRSQEMAAEEMAKVTGGLKMPGLF